MAASKFDVNEFLREELTVDNLRKLLKAELKIVAQTLNVDVTACTRKAEILDAIVTHEGLTQQAAAAASDNHANTAQNESNPMSEINLEKARVELQERKDRLKANEHAREVEKDRLKANEHAREVEKDKLKTNEHEREMERKRLELEILQFEENSQARAQRSNGKSMGNEFAARLKLVPKFDESDLDSFFCMFERIAMKMEWPEDEWAFLIQQVVTGKAQSVVSALSNEQSFDYWLVKETILQSFELIPEAYRQKFRNLRRNQGETHVEFVRRKEIALDRWIRSLKVDHTFKALREVMLIEECKRCMNQEVRTYVNDRDVCDVKAAAILADGYELTHRGSRSPPYRRRNPTSSSDEGDNTSSPKPGSNSQSSGVENANMLICYYCKQEGHVKTQCPKLKEKEKRQENDKSQPNGLVRIAPACMQNHIVHDFDHTKQSDELRNDVDHHDEVDEGYKDFVSRGVVKFSVDEELPVMILRDTGATQTLLVADESSLGTKNFTGKNVLIQDVNGGYKPVPLYNIELNSLLVSGAVTVGIVAELPMRGISLLLGNDLAGGKVLPSPIVCDSPVEDSVTETLKKEIPRIFPSCVVTRAQAMKEKDDEVDSEVMLGDTFFRELNESREDVIPTETVFSQPVLIEAQEEAEDVKRPPHQIKPAPLIPIPVSQEPFSHVLIECVGPDPFPETKSGLQVVSDVFHGDVKCANSDSCEVDVVHVQDDVHSDAHSYPDVDFEAEVNPRVEKSKVMSSPEMFGHLSDSERKDAEKFLLKEFRQFPEGCGTDYLSCAEGSVHKVGVEGSGPLKQHLRGLPPERKLCLIPNFSEAVTLLIDRLKKGVKFKISVTCETAFQNPLTFLERFRNKNQRLFCWSMILQPYGLKVTHIKGKDNIITNALSRT